jgi:prephenate dehydrogenase
MLKEIAIVGAGGRMGCWFSKHFSKRKGVKLMLYDINSSSVKASKNAIVCNELLRCVANADLVMVCVPISQTALTIRKCATKMKPGAILAEIASIKHQSYEELKRIPDHVKPLSIHPMFGPAAPSINSLKILIIPVRDKVKELRVSRDLFDGAIIKIVHDAKTHDISMSVILGLTYFMNLAFASFLSKKDLLSLERISGTTFRIQSLLSGSVLLDDPDLIVSLLSQNLVVRKHIRRYLNESRDLERLISKHNQPEMKSTIEKLKSNYPNRQNLTPLLAQLYKIISRVNRYDCGPN